MASPALLLVEVGVLFGLFLGSAFFSMSETALIGVQRWDVRRRAEEGSARAKVADRLLDDPERVIATVLVGNTIVNICAAALGTVIAAQLFERWATVIATVAVTVVVLLFCEVIPKTLAVQNPLAISLLVARPLRIVETVLKPIVAASSTLAKWVARAAGGHPAGKTPFVTADEIEMMVRMGVQEGELQKFEQRVISELFQFTDTDVHKVMTPASKVHFLPKESTLQQAADLAGKEGRTRVLVVDGDFDHVLGCVHVRDLLRFSDLELARLPVTAALRGVLFAPHDLPADRLLVRMQKEHRLLAVIQGPDGRNLGIATVEDLLEELVGEIHDEFDQVRAPAPAAP